LWLTDAGRALQKPVEAERRAIERKVTAVLSETERKHLLAALAKIHQAASALLDDSGRAVDEAN
jgi:DNA-binding MarR family transcriptional regulator